MVKKHLFVGFGDIALGTIPLLQRQGDKIVGVSRRPRGVEGVEHWLGDVQSPEILTRIAVEHFDSAVIALSPDRYDESGYKATYLDSLVALLALWQRHQAPDRIIFISSTSVYGQNDGQWVDENSPCQPTRASAAVLLECEKRLLESGLTGVVLRYSGIYGPGRDYLLRQVWSRKGGNAQYTNRIHIADCCGALCHIINLEEEALAPIYLASDRLPVTSEHIRRWLAEQMGIGPDSLEPQADSGRGGNKRCDSGRLVASGYQFIYPTFEQGYPAAISEFLKSCENWE